MLLVEGAGVAAYELTLRSDSEAALEKARSRLRSQEWVSSLEESPGTDGAQTWLIRTTDESSAEKSLLRLVLEGKDIRVSGFGRKRQSLEEAFFDLIEKGGSGGN